MIRDLPQRAPELGRLRLGDKEEATNKKGERYERPKKLDTWRITSADEYVVRAAAAMFGGDVEPWESPNDGPQFEVITEASTIEVLIPPEPVDSAYETWGKGGRQRRCDGFDCTVLRETGRNEKNQPVMEMIDTQCICKSKGLVPGNGEDVKKGACDMVLRLRVVIPGMPGLGVFLLSTGSYYAVTQIPAQVQLLSALSDRGALVPAELCVVFHREKKSWEPYAREFYVPELRVRRSMTQLAELAGVDGPAALAGGGAARQLAAGTGTVHRESSRPSTIGDLAPTNQAVIYECSKAKVSDQQAHAISFALSKGRTSSRKDLTTLECAQFLGALADGSWQQLAVAGDQPTTVHEAGPAGRDLAAEQERRSERMGRFLGLTSDEAEQNREFIDSGGDANEVERTADQLWERFRALPPELQADARKWTDEHGIPGDPVKLTVAHVAQVVELLDALESEAAVLAERETSSDSWSVDDWKDAAKAAGVTQAALLKEARAFAGDIGITAPRSLEDLTDDTLTSRVRGWLQERKAS